MQKTFFYIIILLFFFPSCKQHYVQTIIQMDIGKSPNPNLVSKTKKELVSRLKESGFSKVEIKSNEHPDQLIIKSNINPKGKNELDNFRSVFQYTSLGFWNTYRIGDTEIENIKADLPSIPSFVPNENLGQKFSPYGKDKEVLGTCSNSDDLENVKTLLSKSLKKYKNLGLYWDYTPLDFQEDQPYRLYMINTEGKSRAPVTDRHLIQVTPTQNQTGFIEIAIELNDEGTDIWKLQTKKAAASGNRCIAIVINDRVFSMPIVQSEITGGQSAISGGFSLEKAIELSKALSRSMRIPYRINIIQETVDKK